MIVCVCRRYLRRDKDEQDAIREAKQLEEEKAQFAVRAQPRCGLAAYTTTTGCSLHAQPTHGFMTSTTTSGCLWCAQI